MPGPIELSFLIAPSKVMITIGGLDGLSIKMTIFKFKENSNGLSETGNNY